MATMVSCSTLPAQGLQAPRAHIRPLSTQLPRLPSVRASSTRGTSRKLPAPLGRQSPAPAPARAPPRRTVSCTADVAPPSSSVELPVFDFPGVPVAVRRMMDEVVLKVQDAVGEELLPTTTPRNVRRFTAPAPGGQNEGFVWVFRGKEGAKVRRVLVSWLLCKLPGGFAFGKATVTAFMSPARDTPHLVLEFTFSGSDGVSQSEVPPLEFDKMFAAMDLLPRKDPVMHPEYLKEMYEDTGIDKLHAELSSNKAVQLYVPPTMYMRALFSPAALTFHAAMAPESSKNADLVNLFQPAAFRVADVWAHSVRATGKPVPPEDVPAMRARDAMYEQNGTVADLEKNLPMLFGEEITQRVVSALQD